MRILLTALICLLCIGKVYAQNTDSLQRLADVAVKSFTWDVEKHEKGTMMFLDVPFQKDNSDSVEYLTLTIAKNKEKQRPEFISVIIPSDVVQSNGIFIKFSKTIKKDGGWDMELEKGNPERMLFEKCNDEYCTARVVDGYLSNEEEQTKVDIFQKFLDFDHVLFLFVYPDGSHKSVSVPLFSFKEQYRKI